MAGHKHKITIIYSDGFEEEVADQWGGPYQSINYWTWLRDNEEKLREIYKKDPGAKIQVMPYDP
jgi:hypothetical protein